jgi:hypothetical protein
LHACAGLLSGAKKYRDALASMTEAQQTFAASLAEFGAGSDEDSLLLGELAGQGRHLAGIWLLGSACLQDRGCSLHKASGLQGMRLLGQACLQDKGSLQKPCY